MAVSIWNKPFNCENYYFKILDIEITDHSMIRVILYNFYLSNNRIKKSNNRIIELR